MSKSFKTSSAATVTGIDIDGPTATTAVLSDGVVVTTRVHTADTGVAALSQALDSVNSSDQVVVTISSSATKVTLTTLPEVSDAAASRLLGASGTYTVARVLTGSTTVLYGVPTDFVDATYQALSSRPTAKVLAQPAVLDSTPGLVLRIGHRVVDLSFSADGSAAAYSVLPVRGLQAFIDDLGGVGSRARVDSALAGRPTDAIVAAETTLWLTSIAEATKGAVNRWDADGFNVTNLVTVAGTVPAASLAAYLSERSLTLNTRMTLSAVSALPDADKAAVLPAVRASLSYPFQPGAVLKSSDQVSAIATLARKGATKRKRRTFVVAVLALVAPSLVLLGIGAAYTTYTDPGLSAAQSVEVTQVALTQASALAAPYTFAAQALPALYKVSPAPVSVSWYPSQPVKATFPADSAVVLSQLEAQLPGAVLKVVAFTPTTTTVEISPGDVL